MRYDPKIREQAFVLWCEGLKLVEVAERLQLPRPQTLTEWKKRDKWDARRKRIEARAVEKVDERLADDTANMLLEHERAGRGVRLLALRALKGMAERSKPVEPTEENPDPPPAALPNALDLQRTAAALKSAVQIERQARGLPAEGRPDDENPLDKLEPELIMALYEAAKDVEREKLIDDDDDNPNP